METICSKCGAVFEKGSMASHGNHCPDCHRGYLKNYKIQNKEKLKIQDKAYREYNKDAMKKYYETHKNDKKDEKRDYLRRYYSNNKEILLEKQKIYRSKNKDRIRNQSTISRKYKYQNNIEYRIINNLRSRMYIALSHRMATKSDKTINLLGCSIGTLINHIESMFSPGMTWDNKGRNGWDIDHIIPCSSFDLSNPEQQKICFHYTNLQPLWHIDNIKKGSRTY